MSVMFPVLPFVQAAQASLACQLLASTLKANGLAAKVIYLNFEYARRIGLDAYTKYAGYYPRNEYLLGEMLFSQVLNKRSILPEFASISNSLRGAHFIEEADFVDRTAQRFDEANEFIEWSANKIARNPPKVLALSSLFQQHCAVLALAQRTKELCPDLFIMLGGSNCEGAMGLATLNAFPFIDCVVSGPGEEVILPIVLAVIERRELPRLRGVFYRGEASRTREHERASEPQLDDQPLVDFDDYFDQLAQYEDLGLVETSVPIETSRGCWWGEKNHCTFCGLNGSNMRFRQKTAKRALAEMRRLHSLYPHSKITPVDNILSLEYFTEVIPELIVSGVGALFYEVKANLRREQVSALKNAGIMEIQPGIESLSDANLRRMRKGVSAAQNVFLLLMCKEEGVGVIWNILYGFPGETATEYNEQLKIIQLIKHLPPPIGYGRVRLDRFSPLYTEAAHFGITQIRPVDAYQKIYSNLSEDVRASLAYYFDGEYAERAQFELERRELGKAIDDWRSSYGRSFLFIVEVHNGGVIIDTRETQNPTVYCLGPVEMALFRNFRQPVGIQQFYAMVGKSIGVDRSVEFTQRCLRKGLVLQVSGIIVPLIEVNGEVGRALGALIISQTSTSDCDQHGLVVKTDSTFFCFGHNDCNQAGGT